MGVSIRNNICTVCGKQFKSLRGASKYCSIECKARWRADRYGKNYDEVLRRLMRQDVNKTPVEKKPVEKPIEKYYSKRDVPPVGWRCRDCGKPSSYYRCSECKAKWLKKQGMASSCEDNANEDADR